MKPYDLLATLPAQIEDSLTEKVRIQDISARLGITEVHLQRIFKFAYGIPLASYIRSRKLAASLDPLLNGSLRIVDIAQEYGFEYEQTYIRAFKREFGLTPDEYRRSGKTVKIMPALALLASQRTEDGLFTLPEIVMVPEIKLIGKLHKVQIVDIMKAYRVARDFAENDMDKVPDAVNPNVFIGLTRITDASFDEGCSYYLPSVQVNDITQVPKGFTADCFSPTLCARFRYMGKHHYYDINAVRAKQMYKAIEGYINRFCSEYNTQKYRLFFEKIDKDAYDGTYCQMEWYMPVRKKS